MSTTSLSQAFRSSSGHSRNGGLGLEPEQKRSLQISRRTSIPNEPPTPQTLMAQTTKPLDLSISYPMSLHDHFLNTPGHQNNVTKQISCELEILLSGVPSGWGAGGGAQTRVHEDLRANSLSSSVPSKPRLLACALQEDLRLFALVPAIEKCVQASRQIC
ncbi:hypothetical protein PoB_005295100 [Plakobranchus ocellatus]|uniref:Uncharacterized protein n=1 Tax=Plakobranchus ocellatus TaxID=259542 RepID=A0AAV4C511_9GAST|nr:hypothetical protein PoB_005295100 [Plakobranchus ocellatus]